MRKLRLRSNLPRSVAELGPRPKGGNPQPFLAPSVHLVAPWAPSVSTKARVPTPLPPGHHTHP